LPRKSATAARAAFGSLAFLADVLAVMSAAMLTGAVYHQLVYAQFDGANHYLALGLLVALIVSAPGLLAGQYAADRYLAQRGDLRGAFLSWNVAAMGALTLAFLTKTSADFSRGSAILFYIVGFAMLGSARVAMAAFARSSGAPGGMMARRVFLVGREREVNAFIERHAGAGEGIEVVAAAILREGKGTLGDDLALAAASARMLRPDEVFILAPWSQTDVIDSAVDAFLKVPAAIHLGPERVLDRFEHAHISKVGSIASLFLVRRPLDPVQVLVKRALDIILSAILLVALTPLFAVVALLVKLDSKGPVFFAQRRYGFNQVPFRILKFRSMSVMDDGAVVRQATRGDARVTRVGYWLRRLSIDELPQLWNVLKGDMSLIGPRPHALAHDQAYDRRIALYARRHNVKPGITGWAQVNGLRGETDTDAKMAARVEHDLHYIDNWSLTLDIKILFLTAFSKKTFSNAH
jgi:Undecaprenyl-phosphate glucose phosphotransferase